MMTADGVASITDSPSLSLPSLSGGGAAGAGGGPDDAGGDGDDGSEPSPSPSRSSFPAALSSRGTREPGGRRATGGGGGGGQGQGRGGDGAAASSSSPSPTNADSVGGSSRHVGNSPSGADAKSPPLRFGSSSSDRRPVPVGGGGKPRSNARAKQSPRNSKWSQWR